jgi:hypothetical protein
MIYEIVNIHDPYTIEGDNLEVICLCVLILGNGAYALRNTATGAVEMPIFFDDQAGGWFEKKFGHSIESALEDFLPETLAGCMEGVVIGSVQLRRLYDSLMKNIPDEPTRVAIRSQWLDTHRSSVNDIGGRAAEHARALRQMRRKESARA